MKKYIVFLISFLFIASCGTNSQQIEQAKKELFQTGSVEQALVSPLDSSGAIEEQIGDQVSPTAVSITAMSQEQFLQIDPISESDILDGEVEISGSIFADVEKIEVIFENATSEFPRDEYTLQTFKKGDTSFKYLASSRFQVLDFGENIYTIKAYKGSEISETQVVLQLATNTPISTPVEISKDVNYKEKIIGGEETSITLKLPESTTFGNPVSLGVDSITYSNINNFEIVQQDVSQISCENITSVLGEKLNTYYFWNTCRDIVKDKGISFYVIFLSGPTYTYQKHYVDYVHGFYAVYDIETGTGVDKDTISQKNDELKANNERFTKVVITDDLMKKIVNSD